MEWMKIEVVEKTLAKLAELIRAGSFEELETDTLELKTVPADSSGWRERHKSVCAFLNTRGGILILGIGEEGQGARRRYVHSGWKPHAEPNLKELPKQFTERNGTLLDLGESFPPPMIREFLNGQVAVQLIDELASDQKFVFYRGEAYKRIITGDHRISEAEIESQEEFKQEALFARELQPVQGVAPGDLNLDALNEYIQQLNKTTKIETIKADLNAALPFLERKCFVKDGQVTTLGMLVCGKHPEDALQFRCHVHGYVDVPQEIARDKHDMAGNILPLMEASLAYILRNIQVGVTASAGGGSTPQYPEELLRETVNNSLAHRDYSVNKQGIVAVKPGIHLSIRNPGSFRRNLLIEDERDIAPVRRIIPEAKPRNPKLADVLRVYRKWEGRGIGMATLVNLCLQNQIDLPYYRLYSEEVCLFLRAGRLVDRRMKDWLTSFDAFLESKLQGRALSDPQQAVLSYLIKSQWANEKLGYTILLTPDNNHFGELLALEQASLIFKHPTSTSLYPVYVVDQLLVKADSTAELRRLFGARFDMLNPMDKDVLSVVYRYNKFSKLQRVSAKQASFSLWYGQEEKPEDIRAFDSFYRKVRYSFNRLADAGFVIKLENIRGYAINEHLGPDLFR
jgi:ATP-dependent DNA helicase RecG